MGTIIFYTAITTVRLRVFKTQQLSIDIKSYLYKAKAKKLPTQSKEAKLEQHTNRSRYRSTQKPTHRSLPSQS